MTQSTDKRLNHWRWFWNPQVLKAGDLADAMVRKLNEHFEILDAVFLDDLYTAQVPDDIVVMFLGRNFFKQNVHIQKYLIRNFKILLVDTIDSHCITLGNLDFFRPGYFLNTKDLHFAGSNVEHFTQGVQNAHQIFANAWPMVVFSHDQLLTESITNTQVRNHMFDQIAHTSNQHMQIPCRAPRPSRLELLNQLWQAGIIPSEQVDWSLVYLPENLHPEYTDFADSGLIPRCLELEQENLVDHYRKKKFIQGQTPYKFGRSLGEGSLCSAALGKYGWYVAAETFADDHHSDFFGKMSHITEKSYKGFLQGSNTIILGGAGHEAKLREQGFWLPDYGIDHLDGLERARAIAELVPEMLADTTDYTDQRIHNFRLVTDPEWIVDQAVGDLIHKLGGYSGK